MIVRMCREPSVERFQSLLDEVSSQTGVKAVLILACDANSFVPERVDPILKSSRLPVFGGCFPQIIAGRERLQTGTLVAGLRDPVNTAVIRGLGDEGADVEKELTLALDGVDCAGKTIFTFVDGLSSRIAPLIEGLFDHLGHFSSYLGGGAGSLSLRQKACLFTNEGMIGDAAVLAISDVSSGIGVAHGWKPISEAFRVTEAQRNRVVSLNWEPAFEVYRQVVESHSGLSFDGRSFFDIAKAYPLGIVKLDAEMIVRDPIRMDNGHLVCVGEMPAGSFVHIMHGDIDSLIEGAAVAGGLARESYSPGTAEPVLFLMDCISRVLYMGDDIERELSVVARNEWMIGAMTIGEIANAGQTCLEFYNKTVVAGLLGDTYEDGNLQRHSAGTGVCHQR
jgi:hypothetical protein